MKRPRTIFPGFALLAVLAIGFALGRIEQGAPFVADAQIIGERGSRAPASSSTPTPQQTLGARLIVPVRGVVRRDLADTWGDARSDGRSHEGIDIMAPSGTPVLAVADGRIVKFFDSVRGGVTIYQFDRTERFVSYYAHLNARTAGLAEGDQVRQGQVIGYVGTSGNAPVPHLHFEIQRLGAERRWWEADSMNPYPLLMTGAPPR
jgi:murein DD-endopeptidase MepM/ murein hydrolase activator NlpD